MDADTALPRDSSPSSSPPASGSSTSSTELGSLLSVQLPEQQQSTLQAFPLLLAIDHRQENAQLELYQPIEENKQPLDPSTSSVCPPAKVTTTSTSSSDLVGSTTTTTTISTTQKSEPTPGSSASNFDSELAFILAAEDKKQSRESGNTPARDFEHKTTDKEPAPSSSEPAPSTTATETKKKSTVAASSEEVSITQPSKEKKAPSFAFPGRKFPDPSPKSILKPGPRPPSTMASTPTWSPLAQSLFCPPPHLQQPGQQCQQPAPAAAAYYYPYGGYPAAAVAAPVAAPAPVASAGLPVSTRQRSPFWSGTAHYLTNPPPPPPQIYSVEPAYFMQQQPQPQASYYQVAAPVAAPAYYYVAGAPAYYYAG
ncbi:hypothetical protein F5Y17DRAFT_446037 [Xylariaceae sp. FL0594]|nr:hypothetical protein F5Y17DRAFT_446037 [Xylariaceae sp. FL0594]